MHIGDAGERGQCVDFEGQIGRHGHALGSSQTGDQFAGSAPRDDLTAIEDRQVVAQDLGLVHVVSRDQHRAAARAEGLDDVPQAPTRGGVQTRRGFVQEQQVRIPDQGTSQGQTLPLPTGKLIDLGVALFLQSHEVQHFIKPAPALVEAAEQPHGFEHRRLVPHLGVLQLHADALAYRVVVARSPAHAQQLDLAVIGVDQALEHLDRGRFAGPVGAQQAEHLPAGKLKVDAVDRGQVAKALDQATHRKRRAVRGRRPHERGV